MIVARYVADNDGKALGLGSPLNKRVQSLLNRATIHPKKDSSQQIRGEGSVKRKPNDYVTNQPDYKGVATKGGATSKRVIAYWLSDPVTARAEAIALERMIERGEPMRSPDLAYEKDEAHEGTALLVRHKRRERDPKLRAKKIAASASLDCEVCSLNFSQVYGERGEGYIEVHHTILLHVSGTVMTTLLELPPDDPQITVAHPRPAAHSSRRLLA